MQCHTPYLVRDIEDGTVKPVPCGRCPACFKRRISQWSFRLQIEEKFSKSSTFITLTYEDSNLPVRGGANTLRKRHLQLFFKRLRINHVRSGAYFRDEFGGEIPIRYFACGEYGTVGFRPHYHALVFDANLELIDRSWRLGYVHYGDVEPASIGYVLKYMCKPSHSKRDKRDKEFQCMSKGIGLRYLSPEMFKYHHGDLTRMYCILPGGDKVSMPRYYKDFLFDDEMREAVAARYVEEYRDKEFKRMNELVAQYGSREEVIKVFNERRLVARNNYFKQSNSDRYV